MSEAFRWSVIRPSEAKLEVNNIDGDRGTSTTVTLAADGTRHVEHLVAKVVLREFFLSLVSWHNDARVMA